jgi:Cu/Ag efflux pump CusA
MTDFWYEFIKLDFMPLQSTKRITLFGPLCILKMVALSSSVVYPVIFLIYICSYFIDRRTLRFLKNLVLNGILTLIH